MPWSSQEGKETIRTWLRELAPATVLDVGPGAGTYADLIRSINSSTEIDAVEIHEPYVGRFSLRARYREVWVMDARALLADSTRNWDVVILGDVLEHLPKAHALGLWSLARNRANRAVIASVPLGYCPQGSVEGNEHERHLSTWWSDDVRALPGFAQISISRDDEYKIATVVAAPAVTD